MLTGNAGRAEPAACSSCSFSNPAAAIHSHQAGEVKQLPGGTHAVREHRYLSTYKGGQRAALLKQVSGPAGVKGSV